MFDLIIRQGRICDGSGAPSFIGDVGVRDGRIAAVGPNLGEAGRIVDASGHAVAPGFIDPHTHYDAQLTWDGLAQPSLEHGVTTVIPGNCSLSLAPLRADHREFLGAVFRQIEEMPKSASKSETVSKSGANKGWTDSMAFSSQVPARAQFSR